METDSPVNSILQSGSGGSQTGRAVIQCLRFAVAIQCFGVAGRYLWTELESESHIFEYLLFERGFSENAAQWLDDTGAYLCLAAGIVFAFKLLLSRMLDRLDRRTWYSILAWCEIVAAGFVATWFVADALALTQRGGVFSELTIGEVAVRFACPLVLILLIQSPKKNGSIALVARLFLTFAISVTFIVHGYKSVQLYGPFCDLILLSDARISQFEIEQSTAELVLSIIGWLDITLAIALLFTRYKVLATYMLLWGLITSVSRMTAFGWVAWPDTLVRAANWGSVLALALMWRCESAEIETSGSMDESNLPDCESK